jgi:hypothetical protein
MWSAALGQPSIPYLKLWFIAPINPRWIEKVFHMLANGKGHFDLDEYLIYIVNSDCVVLRGRWQLILICCFGFQSQRRHWTRDWMRISKYSNSKMSSKSEKRWKVWRNSFKCIMNRSKADSNRLMNYWLGFQLLRTV